MFVCRCPLFILVKFNCNLSFRSKVVKLHYILRYSCGSDQSIVFNCHTSTINQHNALFHSNSLSPQYLCLSLCLTQLDNLTVFKYCDIFVINRPYLHNYRSLAMSFQYACAIIVSLLWQHSVRTCSVAR